MYWSLKRVHRGVAAAVCVAALLAAFDSISASAATFKPVPKNTKVAISFVTYLPLVGGTAGTTTLNYLIGSFEKAHPNITVTPQTISTPSGAGVAQLVEQDEAAGTRPDVVQTIFDGLRYMATGGPGVQSLTKVVGTQALNKEFGGDHPYPNSIVALGQFDGQQYGVPFVLSTPVLFYNATLFQQAGLNPNDPPKTWAQVESDGEKITKATGASGLSFCGAGTASAGTTDWCTQALIDSNGGSVFGKNINSLGWTNPKTVGAINELGNLAKAGVLQNITAAQAVQEFGQGKLAMFINSSAEQSSLLSEVQGHYTLLDAALPSFSASKSSIPTNSGSALTITSTSSLKQRADWELIQWLTSDQAYTTITEDIGYAPLRTSLVNDPKYLKDWGHTQTLTKVNLAQLAHVVPWQDYPGPNFSQVEADLENAVSESLFEGQSAAAALAGAQSQATALLK